MSLLDSQSLEQRSSVLGVSDDRPGSARRAAAGVAAAVIEDRLVTVHEHRLLGNGQQLISSQRRLHEQDGFADAAHIDLEVRPLDQPTACHNAIIGPTPVIPAQIMQLDEALGLIGFSFGCLPRRRPLAFATFIRPLECASGSGRPRTRRPGQHVEKQPADRVGGVVDRPARTELHVPLGRLVPRNNIEPTRLAGRNRWSAADTPSSSSCSRLSPVAPVP